MKTTTMKDTLNTVMVALSVVALAASAVACAAAPRAPMEPSMQAAMQPQMPAAAPAQLKDNHFRTDRTSNLSEAQLREILDAPVLLEEEARVGIVPVATAYEVDNSIPVNAVPHHLSTALEKTGLFDVTTEVATDWPADGSVAGLRELAARYRVKYLLLYRHRFVDADYTNGWAWTWPTLVGFFAAPSQTMQTAGVMEASLFDVRTGTILFTVNHRVSGHTDDTLFSGDREWGELKEELLVDGTRRLTDLMVGKVRRLAAQTLAYHEERAAAERKAAHIRKERQVRADRLQAPDATREEGERAADVVQ